VPTGFKLGDGYQTEISFSRNNAVKFWEKTIKAPGLDGGDGIDTTTQLNTKWRTKDTRHLQTLTECTFTAGYDPDFYTDILALINSPGGVTIQFPDDSTLTFWGYLQKIEFAELKEGEFPECTGTITPTNWDPANYVESAPVFVGATLT
jgi:hypothetical protein